MEKKMRFRILLAIPLLTCTAALIISGYGINLDVRPEPVLNEGFNNGASFRFISQDRVLVSVSGMAIIRIWDTATGRLIKTIHGEMISFSDDEVFAAVKYSVSHNVYATSIYRTKDWEVTGNLPGELKGFSPDGKIAMLWVDMGLDLYDTGTCKLIRSYRKFPHIPEKYIISPDNRFFATATNAAVKLWSISDGRLIMTLPDERLWNVMLFFISGGRELLTVTYEQAAIWESSTGKLLRTISPGKDKFRASTGRYIIASSGSVIRVLDVDTGREMYAIDEKGESVGGIHISPDNRIFASEQNNIYRFYDLATGRTLSSIECEGGANIMFSPDGRFFNVGSVNTWSNTIWETDSGKKLKTLTRGFPSFSADGKTLATISDEGSIALWDTTPGIFGFKGSPVRQFGGTVFDYPRIAAISPDGRCLAVVLIFDKTEKSRVVLWDLVQGRVSGVFDYNYEVEWLGFSADSGLFATIRTGFVTKIVVRDTKFWRIVRESDDKKALDGFTRGIDDSYAGFGLELDFFVNYLRIRDRRNHDEIMTLSANSDRLSDALFTQNGRLVITCTQDKTIRFWDLAQGKLLVSCATAGEDYVVFTPDCRYDGSGDALDNLHFVDGNIIIQHKEMKKYYTKGLLGFVLKDYLNAGRIEYCGKIGSTGKEVVVNHPDTGKMYKNGDRFFVMVNGERIGLTVKSGMQTITKCIPGNAADSGKLVKGMPVFMDVQ